MSTEPVVLSGLASLRQALEDKSIDGAAVTSEEFLSLDPRLQGTNLFVTIIGGRFTEDYLLLVRRDSGFADLRSLRRQLETSRDYVFSAAGIAQDLFNPN